VKASAALGASREAGREVPVQPTRRPCSITIADRERIEPMLLFAHHMAVEILGREFSPHGVVQHVCVFAALALNAGLCAVGIWTLAAKALEATRARR
jgi:hypothetical protein